MDAEGTHHVELSEYSLKIDGIEYATGDDIRFEGERNWWQVRASSGRWVVVTRQAPFQPTGTLWYAIIDRTDRVRGAVDLLGGGWGDGTYSDQQCAELLSALQAGQVEVSHRNRVPLNITDQHRDRRAHREGLTHGEA